MNQEKTQTLIYVENYNSFVNQHGLAKLDKNIADAYHKATGRTKTARINSSIQKGYIFAWESPFPRDVEKDFAFSLSIDYSAILAQLEINSQPSQSEFKGNRHLRIA